jgi:lipid-binding SYLF domain-containing protein
MKLTYTCSFSSTQASAKALIFLTAIHGGIVVGGLHATGFMITHTQTGAWSAPCFVTLNRVEIGAVLGLETVSMLMVSCSVKLKRSQERWRR